MTHNKEGIEMQMKTVKDFMDIQRDFFKSVLVDYLSPLKIVIAFISIIYEMVRQCVMSFMMDSDEFSNFQDMKHSEEVLAMIENQRFMDAELKAQRVEEAVQEGNKICEENT